MQKVATIAVAKVAETVACGGLAVSSWANGIAEMPSTGELGAS